VKRFVHTFDPQLSSDQCIQAQVRARSRTQVRALFVPIFAALLASPVVGACGDFPDHWRPGNGPHPRHDSGAPAADAGASDSTADARAEEASTVDASSDLDAAARSDASSVPDCVPACIRKALEPCLPVLDSCVHERLPPDAGTGPEVNTTDTICSAEANWSSTVATSFHSLSTTIRRNGAVCYREALGWGIGLPPNAMHYDSTGRQVAWSIGLNDGTGRVGVQCSTSDAPPDGSMFHYIMPRGCALPTHRCSRIQEGSCQ
jgi:hypothetical protein